MQRQKKIRGLCLKKKVIYVLLSLIVLGSFEILAQKNKGFSTSQLIVMFKENVELEKNGDLQIDIKTTPLNQTLALMGCEKVVKLIKSSPREGQKRSLHAQPYIIEFNKTIDVKSAIDGLMETGLFEYVEADEIDSIDGEVVIPDDTYFANRQWALENDGTFANSISTVTTDADIDMSDAWSISQGNSSIIVAVTDTGIKLDHPEFSGRIWTNTGEIADNGIDDDGNGYIDDVNGWDFDGDDLNTPDSNPTDDNGHGTNVAGIIGANGNNGNGYTGIDWNCKIMPLKVFHNASGPASNWIAAIYYAVDNGADIINMSIRSFTNTQSKIDAINYAYDNNVVIVTAMANENDNTPYYPAAYANTIAVGATDTDNTRAQPFNWSTDGGGSNYGNHIDLVAPGNTIYGLNHLSNTNYTWYWSGTSQATPHVTGVVALIKDIAPTIDIDSIRTILHESSLDQLGDPAEDTEGWDQYHGYGLLNAHNALKMVCTSDTLLTVTSRTPYEFGGELLNNAGSLGTVRYYDTLTNVLGCDSVVVLDLFIDGNYGRFCSDPEPINELGIFSVDNLGTKNNWFEYTSKSDGILTLSTCHVENVDTKISIYADDCTTVLAFDDGACGGQSEIWYEVENGTTYNFRFDGQLLGLDTIYTAALDLIDNVPGVWCPNPITIQSGIHTVDNSNGDQWYSFLPPTEGTFSISTSQSNTSNTQIQLYDSFCDVNFPMFSWDFEFSNGLDSIANDEIVGGEEFMFVLRADGTNDIYDFQVFFEPMDPAYCDQFDNDSTLNVSTNLIQYVFDGQVLHDSGTYAKTLISSHECDSLVTLNLTFLGESCLLPKEISGDTIVNTEYQNAEPDWYQYTVTESGLLVIDPTYEADNTKIFKLFTDCNTEIEPDRKSSTENGYLITHEVTAGQVFIVEVSGSASYAHDNVFFEVVPLENGLSCDDPQFVDIGINLLNNHLGERFYNYTFTNKGKLSISSCDQEQDTHLNILNNSCAYSEFIDGGCITGSEEYYEIDGEVGDVIRFSWSPEYYEAEEGTTAFEVAFEESPCATSTEITTQNTINVDNSVGDHWFTYTPTQNEYFIVATWGWTSEDTKISLYHDDCEVAIITEDDNAGIQTIIQEQIVANETYYIQFHDEKTTAVYLAAVYHSDEEIPGLYCTDAINVASGTHTVNNLFGDQWFLYTFPEAGEVTISTNGTTDEDTILDLQGECGSGSFIDSNDDIDIDSDIYQSELKYEGFAGEEVVFVWGADYDPADLYDFEIVFTPSAIIWNGSMNNEWNTAGNWDGGIVPVSTDNVLIADVANDPIVSLSDVTIADLTIEDGVIVTILNDQALAVDGDLIAGTGYLDITFGASLVTNGAVSGTNHIFRRTTTFDTSTGKYSAIGSPVTNEDTGVLGSLIYAYDESVAYSTGGQERFSKVTIAETMNPGDAYFSAFTGTVEFVGTPNTGDIDVGLVYNASEGVDAGFNLVSNPYPSAINFSTFVAVNPDISGTIYLWDDGGSNSSQRGNSDYITINSIGQVANGSGRSGDWNGNIGAAQGFFVKALSAGDLHFTDAMRSTGFNGNSSYFRTSGDPGIEKKEIPTIKLSLSDHMSEVNNETLIGFTEDATKRYDRLYDAHKIEGGNGIKFYTTLNDLPMAIQGLPLITEQIIIPLGFSLDKSGQQVISLSELNNWPDKWVIELEDTELSRLIEVNSSTYYQFSSSAVKNSSRFNLIITPSQILSIDDGLRTGLDIQFTKESITFANIQTNALRAGLSIVDVSGRELFSKNDIHIREKATVNFDFLSAKIYIIRIETKDEVLVHKIRFN